MTSPPNKPQEAVRLYEDPEFRGQFLDLGPGKYNRLDMFPLGSSDDFQDVVSSLTVPDGWVAFCYNEPDFGEPLKGFTADSGDVGYPDWDDQFSAIVIRDPLRPLASRRFFNAKHSTALRKLTAFNHVAGGIALGLFNMGALTSVIGKAESDAGLLPGQVGGDDAKNVGIEEDYTGGKDERKTPGAVFYREAGYGAPTFDDFKHLIGPGHWRLPFAPASLAVSPGYLLRAFDGSGGLLDEITGTRYDLGALAGRIVEVEIVGPPVQVPGPAGSPTAPPPSPPPPGTGPGTAPAVPTGDGTEIVIIVSVGAAVVGLLAWLFGRR